MKVEEFNIPQGLYRFEFEGLDTEFHSHPATEIIYGADAPFSLQTDHASYVNLRFAIIPANLRHKLMAASSKVKMVMIEHCEGYVQAYLSRAGIPAEKNCYVNTTPHPGAHLIHDLPEQLTAEAYCGAYDVRIAKAIRYINNHDTLEEEMLQALTHVTHLSPSRLSHLFKANTGISLKKYFVWNKLKTTISIFLEKEGDLFDALISGKFYDQPHFSKSFKNMLGVKPSKAYNSSTVQV